MGTTKGVRVASGNLCEAEAPTEATAETKPETTEENIMNAKTERQIENLKKQTIGVEIEMNHITRERAAGLATDHFGTGRYEYTASRNGYSTWSAWDAQGREWKFQKDVSIAGCDAEKCELVTPILKYEDIETLQELVRKLRKAGAISHAGIGAGGTHSHWSKWTHTANPAKPRQPYGEPRTADCRCFENRPRQNEPILQNGQSPIHRTAEPEKANQHGTVCRHLVYGERGKLRQKSALQRQSIPYAELPCNFYKGNNRIQTFPV